MAIALNTIHGSYKAGVKKLLFISREATSAVWKEANGGDHPQ